jgi:nicotinate-nucleotide pyrophosphorylase (carboxylating)
MLRPLAFEDYEALLLAALQEDVKDGDRTTDALVPREERGAGKILLKQAGVMAGLPIAADVFRTLDPACRVQYPCRDGDRLSPGTTVLTVDGRLRALLTGERTALNFLQRLSGIATLTRQFVDAVGGTGVEVLDTRKTLPGWRTLAKYAVRVGGGRNHRTGLYDQVLIKDNHLEIVRSQNNCSLAEAVRIAVALAREQCPGMNIEVEVESIECFKSAVEARADIVMLDNRAPEEMRAMVEWLDERWPRGRKGRPVLEASGGISLAYVRTVAETGVDWISVGALTHSAPALDISMEIERIG